MTIESTNFSLNDEEFQRIKGISNYIENQVLILFWQFTIRTLEELDIVSNQNLSIEMFITRLIHISSFKTTDKNTKKKIFPESIEKKNEIVSELKTSAVDQIKNITQEKKIKPETQSKIKAEKQISINSFDQLLEVATEKKEIRLKYELEKNVNLVRFEKNRIEISFNNQLDKNFVKDLSLKLFEWTNERWIITLSKTKGEISIKEKERIKKRELLNKSKDSDLYKNVLEKFSDASLIDVSLKKTKKE